MKKKAVIAIMMTIISLGLVACGGNNLNETNNLGEEAVEAKANETTEEETKSVEEETEQEIVIEETENAENTEEVEEEVVLSWYMDAEGIKSDVMGTVIKKDNAVFEEIGFVENIGVYTPYESGGGVIEQRVFDCNYYEGDIDSYIAENTGMTKDVVNGIEYAYGEDWGQTTNVAFVGNGIVISTTIMEQDLDDNQSVNDYLANMNLIKKCDEFSLDCLAYITQKGLYCPALGISLACEEGENVVNSVGVNCSTLDYTASIRMRDESINGMGTMYYMADTNNAQEVVDKYVAGAIEPDEYKTVENTAIEGTSEINIGKYKFLGRGVNSITDWGEENEDWLFYSDDTTWSVSISYDKGNHYEDYVSVMEVLE